MPVWTPTYQPHQSVCSLFLSSLSAFVPHSLPPSQINKHVLSPQASIAHKRQSKASSSTQLFYKYLLSICARHTEGGGQCHPEVIQKLLPWESRKWQHLRAQAEARWPVPAQLCYLPAQGPWVGYLISLDPMPPSGQSAKWRKSSTER